MTGFDVKNRLVARLTTMVIVLLLLTITGGGLACMSGTEPKSATSVPTPTEQPTVVAAPTKQPTVAPTLTSQQQEFIDNLDTAALSVAQDLLDGEIHLIEATFIALEECDGIACEAAVVTRVGGEVVVIEGIAHFPTRKGRSPFYAVVSDGRMETWITGDRARESFITVEAENPRSWIFIDQVIKAAVEEKFSGQ